MEADAADTCSIEAVPETGGMNGVDALHESEADGQWHRHLDDLTGKELNPTLA